MIEDIKPNQRETTNDFPTMHIPNILRNQVSHNLSQGTVSGGMSELGYVTMAEDQEIIKRLAKIIGGTENQEIKTKASELISRIIDIFQRLRNSGHELNNIPPLNVEKGEDGSLLFQWIFPNFRIGFTTEVDSDESGWYLVSNENMGNISTYGNFKDRNQEIILIQLLNFALSNR